MHTLVIAILFAMMPLTASASLRESQPDTRLQRIELIGEVPACDTYAQFEMYVSEVYRVFNRDAAMLSVNAQVGERACSVVDGRHLRALEIVNDVSDNVVVVRGMMKHRIGGEKYFFFVLPEMLKRKSRR